MQPLTPTAPRHCLIEMEQMSWEHIKGINMALSNEWKVNLAVLEQGIVVC